jgi:nitrite reductase/ring-hydroxylating ferredoxin subunit
LDTSSPSLASGDPFERAVLPPEHSTELPLAGIGQGTSEVYIDGTPVLIHRRGDAIRACPTTCQHHGARLTARRGTDEAVCSWHGWILNTEKMTYTHPAGLRQDELDVDVDTYAGVVHIGGVRKPTG